MYKPADAKGRAENVPVPVLPEEAKAETKEGLEAFAKYWYSTLSYAYETGDMKPLEAITTSSCTTCNSVKESIAAWHAEGRWLAGGALVVQGSQSSFVETAQGEYQATVQVYQEGLSYHRADGTVAKETPREPAVVDIVVAGFRNGAWVASVVEHIGK